ncbi:Oidioi.mRNA.OKI2018_I69.PAR.g12834.t1.cds [Oikopleura dioica]|uniref:Oidioi.mRNA.OKI2018_I69.PAR.g12834.t1.cds n=1 Tax=Oikopleura dioica TaxID=34765 RepID=A0ABN7S2H3_OIKDI|nr:Oidioi.mRNA.OKI2018_I69.PAR.g12834.t1.cds [Oikopleura dioica]
MLVLASLLALCAAAPADSTCPQINQRDQDLEILPKYPLDPEKFITPIYIWGPSSQLQGLREAIGVAIRLNRTLLLPPFLTHSSDPLGNDQPVPTDIRLDIPKLRKLVSIAFTDDLRCLQSDAVFLARGIYNKPTDPAVMVERVKRIENFEKAAHMKVLRRTDDDEVCTVLEKTGSKGLALALARFILQTNAFLTGATQKHSALYVSTPPSEAEKMRSIVLSAKSILENEGWSLDVVTTTDTQEFLDENYGDCEMMQYKSEVLSLVEQELTYRGDYFIFSELSGWSANVRKERIMEDKYFYEMSVIKLIEDFGPFSSNFTTSTSLRTSSSTLR